MNPKEKAEQIIRQVRTYSSDLRGKTISTKQLAYIVCDSHLYSENDSPFNNMADWNADNKYWNEVKEQVNKIIE